ncbi:MAG: hypothetical protein MI747_21975 [Desulfobacterales bacterium]|nr:hypothetical protein [Desulfobacterales bacterium]
MESNEPAHPIPEAEMKDGEGEGQPQVTIDYKDLNKDTPSDQLMVERKDKLGLNKSLDMVVKSNESFTLGDKTISMGKILEKAKTHKGGVYQENLNDSGKSSPKAIKEFGIYVVQPGDNIWNIHFNILKEYYSDRGIDVAPKADEPIKNGGMSSGVGKLLKFSEGMVIIYDLNDDEVAEGINLLQPLSKVVIYNMQEVFNLLSEIDYDTINRIQFDGTNIWIPTEKN